MLNRTRERSRRHNTVAGARQSIHGKNFFWADGAGGARDLARRRLAENSLPAADKPSYGIQKNAYEDKWLAGYNGLSTSVIGLKMKQEVLPYDWSIIGVLEAGISPYSGMFNNGPRSLADNNARPAGNYPWQNRNADSSRAGQWGNSQAYLGVSNPVYGTLTFGRTNSLANDITSAYDPIASNALTLIGFSGSFAGFGNTETTRANTAFTYRLTYQNFRAAAQVQVGSYGIGNATNGMYQGQLGADFGSLSLDGVLSWAKDAVSLSTFGGSNIVYLTPANCFINVNNQFFDPNSVLKATLSNSFGAELGAKYKWDPFTVYGGWIYARLMNPSDDYLTGFPTLLDIVVVNRDRRVGVDAIAKEARGHENALGDGRSLSRSSAERPKFFLRHVCKERATASSHRDESLEQFAVGSGTVVLRRI